MKKYKKVSRTKTPTLKQLHSMASNLRYKLNCSCSVDITTWHMNHRESSNEVYTIYMENEGTGGLKLNTWSELQDKYFNLMRSS